MAFTFILASLAVKAPTPALMVMVFAAVKFMFWSKTHLAAVTI